METSPTLPYAGLSAVVLGSALIGMLHVLPANDLVDPVRRTISEYQLGELRFVFDIAVLLVAAGSAAVFGTVVRRGLARPFGATTILAACWVIGLPVIVLFQKTDWSIGPSLHGTIHRYASVVAFVALPLAVWAAARAAFPRRSPQRLVTVALAVTSLAWFGVILAAVALMTLGGEPWWQAIPLGLVERGMAFNEILAIGSLAVGLRSVSMHDGGHSAESDALRVPS